MFWFNGDTEAAQQAHTEQQIDQQNADNWAEGGECRVGLHLLTGGLTGNVDGALGAGISAASMPSIVQHIEQLNLNPTLTNGLSGLAALGLGTATGGLQGGASAFNVEMNNRQLHWSTFESMREACRGDSSAECQVINRMGGQRLQILDFLALEGQDVVANFGADGKAVSFTIVDADSHQPLFIMEPAEFAAYTNAPESARGWYALSPQWSLDIGSSMIYAGQGNEARASEHQDYVLSSPEYWFTAGLGVLGGTIARTPVAVFEAESSISYERMMLNTGLRNQAEIDWLWGWQQNRIVFGVNNNDAFSYYMYQSRTLNVSTLENTTVFYSGPGNRALAVQFANANGRNTLEMTYGGNWLDAQNLFNPNSPLSPVQATQVWSVLSERFAAGASGNAVGFVQGARPGSIFNTVEFPALQNNPNVINVITGGH